MKTIIRFIALAVSLTVIINTFVSGFAYENAEPVPDNAAFTEESVTTGEKYVSNLWSLSDVCEACIDIFSAACAVCFTCKSTTCAVSAVH